MPRQRKPTRSAHAVPLPAFQYPLEIPRVSIALHSAPPASRRPSEGEKSTRSRFYKEALAPKWTHSRWTASSLPLAQTNRLLRRRKEALAKVSRCAMCCGTSTRVMDETDSGPRHDRRPQVVVSEGVNPADARLRPALLLVISHLQRLSIRHRPGRSSGHVTRRPHRSTARTPTLCPRAS